MKPLSRQLFAVLVVILAGHIVSAQIRSSMPKYASWGGGPFDQINLGNLDLHFVIPVLHKAGRGLPFTYDISYDGAIWSEVASNGATQWQPAASFGWTGISGGGGGGYISYSTVTTGGSCPINPPYTFGTYSQVEYYDFVYTDTLGFNHQLPYDAYYITQNSGCSEPQSGPQPPQAEPTLATDGSGYTMYAVATASSISGYIVTKAGTTLNPSFVNGGPAGGPPAIDANGNMITQSGSAWTDTLGTQVLAIAGIAPNNTTLTYTAPSGGNASYTVAYTTYTVATDFRWSGVSEYGPVNNPLVSTITLPDGTSYQFTYEASTRSGCTPAPNTPHCTTGRIASITLPTGGVIQYTYRGGPPGNNYINPDGTTGALTRTLSATTTAPAQTWQYDRGPCAWSPSNGCMGGGRPFQTVVTDPAANQTVLDFQEDSNTSSVTGYFYETQRYVFQGSASTSACSSTITNNCLLLTTTKCYNGNYSNCTTTAVSSPISQIDAYSQLPSGSSRLSEVKYNPYGLVTDDREYDYGASTGTAPGTAHLVRETATSYASLGNGIVNRPSAVTTYDWRSGTAATLASTTYSYDQGTITGTSAPQHIAISGSRGNPTTVTVSTSSTASLSKTFTYYDTGTPSVATDVDGAQTTYLYGANSCGYSFPTTINEPLNLSRTATWNCNGGVATQVKDENGNSVTTDYSDPNFWRPDFVQDQLLNQTNLNYGTNWAQSYMFFNSQNSLADQVTTVDGFGRPAMTQRQQAPGGAYDSVQVAYDQLGRPSQKTMSYSGTFQQAAPTGTPATLTTYDALGRPLTITDGGGGTVVYQYINNDVLQKVSGTQTFQKQFEYDGLGRLTSVCEISGTLPNVGPCGQGSPQTGYWTQYTYDALGHLLGVAQNSQSGGTAETRSFSYDMLGRMTQEINPESGTTQYFWDAGPDCPGWSTSGELVEKKDNAGIVACYAIDTFHRVVAISADHTQSVRTCQIFAYDSTAFPANSVPAGVTVANIAGRMVEAYTNNCNGGAAVIDEWFSYDKRGQLTDVYESTPHSGGYYHTTASYWPTGSVKTVGGIPGVPTINYGANGAGLDGEGRVTQVTASSGANPVTNVTYSPGTPTAPLGSLTGVTFGSADSDSFTYDPNTGRMSTYTFSVNGKNDAGTLTWNANGTLNQLVINDQIPGTADSQTCTYGYDDLQRIANVTCGTFWVQNFTYDAFGNISKNVPPGDGGLTFLPSYWTSPPTNQFSSLPGGSPQYDKNGNLLVDNLNTYTWDVFGKLASVSTSGATMTITNDALGRMVESYNGSSYTEFVYGPTGKLAKCNGQTLVKALISLPGGAKAVYNSSGLAYYRHSDWLGSSRLTSTASRTMYSSSAYAPFGEQYATAGSADASYTGQDQDTVSNLYDFPARRHSPSQGRWISPDPAGITAVKLTNPQSWNRYAYVSNNPLRLIDPLGMDESYACEDDEGGCEDTGDPGGGDTGTGDPSSGDPGNGDDNSGNDSGCAPDDTQCQQQETDQALQNAALALLTNTDCAGLTGGPSAVGQTAAVAAVAGQLFGNPNSAIQFSATPDPGVPSGTFAVTVGTTVPTNGASISLGQDFYDPLATIINTVGTAGMGLTFGQNQELTVLHEYGHALGIVNPTPGIPYAPATNIMDDSDPSTGLAISGQNDVNVASDCLQGGNVPTQTSQVDGTIQ